MQVDGKPALFLKVHLKKKIMKRLSKEQKFTVREVWRLKPYQRIGDNIKEWIERNIYSL